MSVHIGYLHRHTHALRQGFQGVGYCSERDEEEFRTLWRAREHGEDVERRGSSSEV